MKLRPSDLKRVGSVVPHCYTGPEGVRMTWGAAGDVRGTDGAGTFLYAGEADTAQQAKRVFCDWYNNQQGRD
jgi:hypothetical protein